MLLADAWLRLGRLDEAQSVLEEGFAHAEATGEHFCTAELHRLHARACLAHDARARQIAETALDAALARSYDFVEPARSTAPSRHRAMHLGPGPSNCEAG